LKPVSDGLDVVGSAPASQSRAATPAHGCLESGVLQATSIARDDEEAYQCQAVRLLCFTSPLPWWRLDQYVADYVSGNVSLRKILDGLGYSGVLQGNQGLQSDPWASWPLVVRLVSNSERRHSLPSARGRLRHGEVAPIVNLNLQPGELVRIILSTVNFQNTNRGLFLAGKWCPTAATLTA
jgi:hypothetical protein